MRRLSSICLSFFAVLSFSCSITMFYPIIKNDIKPKSDSIAVIAGTNNKETISMANYMTESLTENSRFKVMSQEKISGSLKGYPYKINGPYSSAYTEIKVDYTKTDLIKIKEIQNKLGVSYVLPVWAPIGVLQKTYTHSQTSPQMGIMTTKEKINTIQIVLQIFEFPGCVQIGEHDRELEYLLNGGYIELTGNKAPNNIEEKIAEYCGYASKSIAKRMGMEK